MVSWKARRKNFWSRKTIKEILQSRRPVEDLLRIPRVRGPGALQEGYLHYQGNTISFYSMVVSIYLQIFDDYIRAEEIYTHILVVLNW